MNRKPQNFSFDFDRPVRRTGTYSVKWDRMQADFGRSDLLPMWVADMDFESPEPVRRELERLASVSPYGYAVLPDSYVPAVTGWLEREQGWKTEPEWIGTVAGIVRGVACAVLAFTRPGDRVLIQPPVYHPFARIIAGNGRDTVCNPLLRTESGYAMDFEDLEAKLSGGVRLMILCNPHNPGGLRWTAEDLCRVADLCDRYGVTVVSDEIHADLQLWGNRHIPFATVSDTAARISITFGAPSKSFNIPGLQSSFSVVPDSGLRERFYGFMEANELGTLSLAAARAAEVCYTDPGCAAWRGEVLRYIEGNIVWTEEFCREHLPLIRPLRPQASYLIWLDCRDLLPFLERKYAADPASRQALLVRFFTEEAGLALNDGEMFGTGGTGYLRLNVGTPRVLLDCALESLLRAYSALKV